ncbi:MAG TPA: Sir2 family NAD-dependent protein deacetylase [Gemmatimonadaceae bacterium]|nr:Sir2 family NAD-dependent protein deacetylase [Gemmatimonadaceae bacterium]
MRVIVLSGSGLSADSGLPTFRGAGGLYQNMSAEQFLSAEGYARDPDAVEDWLDRLRVAEAGAQPNAAHLGLAAYQARHPGTELLTQNVDTLLERAGARAVVHLHGRLDQLRCLGHAHPFPLGAAGRAGASARCPRCGSRLRSDVVLFGERAPAYDLLWKTLRHAGPGDALVVIGTQGGVLPVEEIVRAFPGRTLLNNLHESEWLTPERFTRVFRARAADAIDEIVATLDAWRSENAATHRTERA